MTELSIFLAEYLIWGLFASILIILWKRRQKRLAAATILSILLAWTISKFVKDFFYFPRPFIINQASLPVPYLLDGSFPSLHTTVAFAASWCVFFHIRRLGVWLLGAAFLVSWGRISVNLHSPIDIIGGIGIGYLSAKLITNLTSYHSQC